MNELTLQNKVVLITGAGREPGFSLALAFAAEGARIAANDLSPVVLDPLAQAIHARGGQIQTYVADATRGMPLRAMLDSVLEDFSAVDILINNPRIHPARPFLELDEWDWQRTVEMNLNGPFLVTQLVARLMREQGQGVILNIIDQCMHEDRTAGAAYIASQAGLLALSQAAARELIAYNIRVHALCPDHFVGADFNQSGEITTAAPENAPVPGIDLVPLSRLAVFLCSPAAEDLAGQVFQVSASNVHKMPPQVADLYDRTAANRSLTGKQQEE